MLERYTPTTRTHVSFKMYYQALAVMLTAIVGSGPPPAAAANILAFFPLPIYSHFSGFDPLFVELANRGHRVTVVSTFRTKAAVPPTYVHVPITNVGLNRKRPSSETRRFYRMTNMLYVKQNMPNTVEKTLVLKDTQEFLNDTRYNFDVVLCECWYSDVYLALGHRYSAPVVCLSPMVTTPPTNSWLVVPSNPSYVPSVWLYYSDRMSFAERLYNAAMGWAELTLSDVVYRASEQRILDTAYVYPGHQHCPPLDRLRETLSLTLVNSHWSVSYARPYPPNVVSVAGMHMRPPSSSPSVETVSPDFKALIDGATDGVIYFSFGSNINMEDLPKREIRIFVESFRKVRQIVLWKWENGTIDDLPKNVYISKWFPQQYILSHRNCKLFITHGGYHSLIEAINYGLPLIGFPFFTDQYYNTRFVVENGFGIEIRFDDLQQSQLDDAIEKIIFDSSYKENAQRVSEIFLDRSMSALNTAVYWVEYVSRHGVHSNTLNSYGLSWYQYFGLDVALLFVTGLVLSALFLYTSVKCLNSLFNSSKGEKTEK